MTDRNKLREDIEDIIQVKYLYGAVVDALVNGGGQASDLARVFSDDAQISFAPGSSFSGLPAIRQTFGVDTPARSKMMWHSFTNPMIEVSGDTAKGTWLVQAYVQRHGDDTPRQTIGSYEEKYVRTPKGWRISSIVLHRS